MSVMIEECFIHNAKVLKDISKPTGVIEAYTKIAIFRYNGDNDPVRHLDDAIRVYTDSCKYSYTEFIDMNMDNPWVRIVTMLVDKDDMRDYKLESVLK